SLHKRGYRKIVGTAPLKETLAAAMVQLSYWNRDRPLIDPFCGTGTILIEAVMIGRNIAPGLRREFAAQQWDQIPPHVWEDARREAESQQLEKLPETIIGYDTDFRVLKLARYAAEEAGIADEIHFQEKDFRELTSSRHYGCVITNPPYGERIGEQAELRELYRCFPEVLRRLPTWSHYVLTAFSDFEQLVGQQADRRRKLYNGRIECQYFQFHGPRPPRRNRLSDSEEVAAPPPTDSESITDAPKEDAPAFASPDVGTTSAATTPPIQATASWEVAETDNAEPSPPNIPIKGETAERAAVQQEPEAAQPPEAGPPVDADQEDPAVAEQIIPSPPRPKRDLTPAFGGLDSKALEQGELLSRRLTKLSRHLRRWPKKGIHCYRLYDRDIPEIPLVIDRYHDYLHIADYDRPHTRTAAQYADWLEHMCESARRTLEIPKGNVFVKHRTRQRGSTQHEKVGDHRKTITAEEGGLHFEVNLSDYVDTGLFLDHRLTRQRVREEAAGKRVLNLFCYTAAFSVYAAAGGAESTVSVDLSSTYLDWAERNFELNHLSGPRHQFVRSDALEFVRNQRRGDLFDLVVVDVPTFSNSKRTEEVWDVQRDHIELLTAIESTLSSDGVVYFSTNFRRFKFDVENLPQFAVREISQKTVPEDFRNKRIHRCWRMTRSVPAAAKPE
ncbi:MAG: class I SAM-dependent methyltransferase, partial [Pirellulaceae bacterium]